MVEEPTVSGGEGMDDTDFELSEDPDDAIELTPGDPEVERLAALIRKRAIDDAQSDASDATPLEPESCVEVRYQPLCRTIYRLFVSINALGFVDTNQMMFRSLRDAIQKNTPWSNAVDFQADRPPEWCCTQNERTDAMFETYWSIRQSLSRLHVSSQSESVALRNQFCQFLTVLLNIEIKVQR
ncbi:MAG: hypothetical protein RIQ56_284 [Candidatus Parcubacteria bacterium]